MAKSASMMRSWMRAFWCRPVPASSDIERSWTMYRYARRYLRATQEPGR